MSDPITAVELPADPKQWTERECDEALRRIVDHDLALAAARLKHDGRVARAKADYDLIRQPHEQGKKALVGQLRRAAQGLKKSWVDKSLKLFWGHLAFRRPAAKLTLMNGATWQSVIDQVREQGVENGVRVEEHLNLEVLERLDIDALYRLGLTWTSPNDRFAYKTKLEIAAEQTGGRQ
jgi:hypothetical protein